jgi:hypothetical protein
MTQLVTPTVFVLQHEPYPERWQEAEPHKRGVRGLYVRTAAAPRLPEPRVTSSVLNGGVYLLGVVRACPLVETQSDACLGLGVSNSKVV